MESSNSVSSSVLKWENLATKQINNGENCSSSKYPVPISACQESDSVSTAAHDDPMVIGLRLGGRKEVLRESSCNVVSMSSVPVVSTTPTKRSRASYQNMQNPCCQVEGCDLDLKPAKEYHRRHRICESHSKSPKVIVAGMERRFCQQCSRFHDLSEFDDKKRSCRRRLSEHNARRRKVQPESVQLSSPGSPSSLYDERQINFPLNGLPCSTWENATTSMFRQGLIRPSRPPCFSSEELHESIFQLHMDLDKLSSIPSSNPRVLDQCLHIPKTNSPIATDAHSLPSSDSWSLDEGESASLAHGHYINSVMRKSNSEPHKWSLFGTFNIPMEQGQAVTTMVHPVNEGTSNQHEYQLFKAPYDSTAGFCSSQMNF